MSEIPVNIRVIGTPDGEENLYFEDYVYTFMKRMVEEYRQQDCEVMFYGTKMYQDGVENYLIFGAMHLQKTPLDQEYFPAQAFLGRGKIEKGENNDICVSFITQDKKKIKKEDFYIYYAQNEEMQNYMVGWNREHQGIKNYVEHSDAVKYTRMIQNYNREEVKIGFLWKSMNILGLSFIVCVMVYGIVSVNHYHKMRDIEEHLAYVVSVVSDSVKLQTIDAESILHKEDVISEKEENEEEEGQMIEMVQEDTTDLLIEEIEIQSVEEELQTKEETEVEKDVTQMSEERQYIVQKGDTLRSIAYAHYGSHDMVEAICVENGIADPNNIVCGQKLLLP